MKTIMLLKISLLFFYFSRMIVAMDVQDKKSLDRNMIPYKTVYGVPRRCIGISDLKSTHKKYRTCQVNAIKKWQITLEHYYTDSWNFCCFVYDVLKCETKVLSECDENYSDRNDKETRRLFDKSCQPIMANNPCSKSEDEGDDWLLKGLAIGAGVLLFLYMLYECINFWRKEFNTELMAKKAYKAKKFQQKYDKEFIRAVYDHEVEFQDKQYFTNAPKQTSENGEAQPIKKQENVKIPQKELNKIKNQVHSQIEADSKNDPSFWDDFNKDSAKYYVQPTGVKAKAKKYFKRLWPFPKGNSEEQLKREELIRSEARRQYENIRKNRLELDKISTGNESSIEEINDDPLLAKTLRTLNQEHVDVYRETIKTTDFPESGSMDQLEIYTKNFKDTRQRMRNEFDKKLEMKLDEPTIEGSDKGSRKNGNWLRSSTHGSKKAEDEPTKILRRYKDKKTKTPVSMIRSESTSKPTENKTTEILSSDSSQVEKPSNLSLIDEQQSTSKPADDRSTIIPASDSHQVKKPESTVSDVKDQQSITKPADEQVTKIESSDSQIVKKPLANIEQSTSKQTESQKTTEDESTKILRSDSDKDKKVQTPVSMIRTESTSKPKESQTVADSQKELLSQFKKQETTFSTVNEQQSTPEPTVSQATENQKEVSSQDKKPLAKASVLTDIEQSTPESQTVDSQEELSSLVKKHETTFSSVNEQQSTSIKPVDEQVTKIPTSDSSTYEKSQTTSNISANDEQSTLSKLDKTITTKQEESTNFPITTTTTTTTTTETSEPEIKIPIYSEIAKKAYEDGFKYPYYDLLDERVELMNKWKIKEANYNYKLNDLEPLSKKNVEKNHEYQTLKKEYDENLKAFLKQANALNDKIDEARKIMKNDISEKDKRIFKQIERFGKKRNKTVKKIINEHIQNPGFVEKLKKFFKSKDKPTNEFNLEQFEYHIEPTLTENDIENDLLEKFEEQIEQQQQQSKLTSFSENEQKNKSGLERVVKGIFRIKDKKTNESLVVLDPLEYRIEPILTENERYILNQAIEQSSENKEYRTSILKKMLELQSAAAIDKAKTKEAILFRDDYVKSLYNQLVDEKFPTDKSEIKPILTDQDRNYLHQMIDTSQSKHKDYQIYILNEIEEIERSRPLTESDRNDLKEFIEIFKKRLSFEGEKPEYPLSKFRRKYVPGPNPTISEEQEDFLYFESMIKPRMYNRPVDYYVWYFKELFTTKGKYFYDPTHRRFATIDKNNNNLLLENLLSEAISHSAAARNRKGGSISSQLPTVAMNIAENTDVTSNQQQLKYGDQPKSSSSLSSTQSSNTDSLIKRVQRSMNQAFLQTATQMPEHPFTDYSQQF
ncbi:uncharacterized protein LOC113791599 [Dermatophagoides pteronyssinus]|uniref:uncharacterized protein LOC113791599 n=1 Tax=Dermatophagoides pteronyssinus TaxID=6956 RepID=UPI003F66627C